MRDRLLRFDGVLQHDPAIDAWFREHDSPLGALARPWFQAMRQSGDEVREVLHDGCPVACLGDVPFGYVNVFTSHASVGFFQGASLRDPDRLLQGNGRFMRHVKLTPQTTVDAASLHHLIETAYLEMKARLEHG